jgi:F-type H+-transporting ATPase subunit delta
MIANTISRRYAEAIFKASISYNCLEKVYSDLNELSERMEKDKEFRYFMLTPRIKKSRKRELITELFKDKFSEVTIHFLFLLLEKRRQEHLKRINEYFKVLYDRYHKKIEITAVSYVELTEEEKKSLKKILERITGKLVSIINKIDSSILGGLVVKIENKVYDNSIKRHLENVRSEMIGK